MTQGEKSLLLKDTVSGIEAIKAQYEEEVIKEYEIPPLVNLDTKEETGFAVKLFPYTRYDYDEKTLSVWKILLKADEWYISVKRNRLCITFMVRYK